MTRRRRRMQARWARYFNHYSGKVQLCRLGGDSAAAMIVRQQRAWLYMRRQAKP